MTLTCYVIDDEKHAIDVLSGHIMRTPGLQLVATDVNPLEAIRKIGDSEVRPDIIFADIDMPQMTGIDLAEIIGHKALVIFTTAYSNYAVSAFDKNALDYMIKPITYERFLKAVDKARQKLSGKKADSTVNANDFFYIKTDSKGKLVQIFERDIIFIEAKQNYIQLNLETTTYLTYLTLNEILERLSPDRFIRTHKSFIANLEKVKMVEGGMITFLNGKQILLGAIYKPKVMENIEQKIIKSKRT